MPSVYVVIIAKILILKAKRKSNRFYLRERTTTIAIEIVVRAKTIERKIKERVKEIIPKMKQRRLKERVITLLVITL